MSLGTLGADWPLDTSGELGGAQLIGRLLRPLDLPRVLYAATPISVRPESGGENRGLRGFWETAEDGATQGRGP